MNVKHQSKANIACKCARNWRWLKVRRSLYPTNKCNEYTAEIDLTRRTSKLSNGRKENIFDLYKCPPNKVRQIEQASDGQMTVWLTKSLDIGNVYRKKCKVYF